MRWALRLLLVLWELVWVVLWVLFLAVLVLELALQLVVVSAQLAARWLLWAQIFWTEPASELLGEEVCGMRVYFKRYPGELFHPECKVC